MDGRLGLGLISRYKTQEGKDCDASGFGTKLALPGGPQSFLDGRLSIWSLRTTCKHTLVWAECTEHRGGEVIFVIMKSLVQKMQTNDSEGGLELRNDDYGGMEHDM